MGVWGGDRLKREPQPVFADGKHCNGLKQCPTGKISLRSRRVARERAAQLNKIMPPNGNLVRCEPYKCRVCGQWHVGRPKWGGQQLRHEWRKGKVRADEG